MMTQMSENRKPNGIYSVKRNGACRPVEVRNTLNNRTGHAVPLKSQIYASAKDKILLNFDGAQEPEVAVGENSPHS